MSLLYFTLHTYNNDQINFYYRPIMYYPTLRQSSMVVRCCPVLFSLRPNQNPVIALPYRMVVAVATKSAILLYDTQHAIPIGLISNIHYTKLTDLSWYEFAD